MVSHFIPLAWSDPIETPIMLSDTFSVPRGSFWSLKALLNKIGDFVEHHNANIKPFMRTATVKSILAKVQ